MRKIAISTAAIVLGLGFGLGTAGAAKAQDALEYGVIASHSTSGITGFARSGGARNLLNATNNRLNGALGNRMGMRGRTRFNNGLMANKLRFRNSVSRTKFAGLTSAQNIKDRRRLTGQLCEAIEGGVRVMRPRCQ